MQTKFVIVLHNKDEYTFEETPLFDSYPSPSTIEHYLQKSHYHYAKVEKRYSLDFEESVHQLKPLTFLCWLDEFGNYNEYIYSTNEEKLLFQKISQLKEKMLPYTVTCF